ncbi:MAG: tRNA (N6-threonylcarbamoyladenosine(37)-N6)-methyltransferase TrmO [Metallosphaera sp.]
MGYVEVNGQPSRKTESTIVVFDEYSEGLLGLEQFSHAIVIYHLHLARFESLVKDKGERVGVFATRSPNRPNPIGISVVELIEIQGNRLKVTGINALDGTPVLDIKPYDKWDSIPNPRVPKWHNVQ